MPDLADLLNVEDLREQVIERAADKALEDWRPPDKDERAGWDARLYRRVEELFQAEVTKELKEPIANLIQEALEGEFQPTDQYGSPRHGPKKTLREMIMLRVEQEIKLPENRPRHSVGGGRSDTALGEWLSREVTKKVHDALWADFSKIADAVTEAAAAEIQKSIQYLVQNRLK